MVGLWDYMAKLATQGDFDLKRVPLHDYELLVLVMDCFFKKLETGELKWQRNDLFDLFNLAYVRRGDKYWTNEKRWIQIIKAAGCEEYLYDEDKLYPLPLLFIKSTSVDIFFISRSAIFSF